MAIPDPYNATKKVPAIKTSPAPPKPIPAQNTGGSNVPGQTNVTPQMNTPNPSQQAIPDWTTKQSELFGRLESALNTPFMYDPNTDPGYQAQRNLINQRVQDANRSAMETANAKGILGSTMTGEALLDNTRRGELEAASFIPQFREQAYGQYQDRLSNINSLLGTARNFGQDVFNRSVTEADLTGSYLSPDARSKIDRIIQLGDMWQGGTPEQRDQFHQEANRLRAELQGMGIDPSLFGADKTTEQRLANVGRAGTPTMAMQNQSFNQAQQAWENNFKQGQFDWQKAQQIWENAFQEKNFEQSMKEAAASRGLQWANLNQREREFVADMAFKEKQFQLDQDKFNASQSGSSLTSKDSTDNYNMIFDDLQSDGVDKNTARQLLQANRAFLTDSDYNKLNNWINENL